MIAYGILGGTLSALSVYIVKTIIAIPKTGRARALTGCVAGSVIGVLAGITVEVVISRMLSVRSEVATAAVVGSILGTFAGLCCGVIRGPACGVIAGILFGNLVVTTQIAYIPRMVGMIGGVLAGVVVATAHENERKRARPASVAHSTSMSQPAKTSNEGSESEPALLRFVCRQCGKRLKARGQDAGKRTKCSNCGLRIRIPVIA